MIKGLVLASGSPRRRELLEMLGLKEYKVVLPEYEAALPPDLPVGEAAAQVALLKALSVRDKVGNDPVVLAADTVVSLDGRILGKPKDEADAETMLRLLSGRTHAVYTGVALVRDTRQIYRYETTLVSFRQLSQYEISAYISTGEPMDKAGAYGAQGIASLFIRRIEGDYFNVVGLPLFLLGSMLEELGLSAL